MELSPHSLTLKICYLTEVRAVRVFGVCLEEVGLRHPLLSSALPHGFNFQASPKTVSGRTSYRRVRLEFLR